MFDFKPLQFVRVVAFELGDPGRVTQCFLRPNDRRVYEVEYVVEGELKHGEFNADELAAAA